MNGGSAEVGSEVLVMCGSFGLSVMTMRVGQRAYEIAQGARGAMLELFAQAGVLLALVCECKLEATNSLVIGFGV